MAPALLLAALLLDGAAAAPPTVGPPPPELVARLRLDPVHAKHVDAGGFPIVGSAAVHDAALSEARHLVLRMLEHRPDLLAALAAGRTRLVVMAADELTCDVPEHSDLRPRAYWDRRARGLGATRWRPAVSCGEENLLGFPGDPYATESLLVHEFAHAVHQMAIEEVDGELADAIDAAYAAATEEGLWAGTYAGSNAHEYWAEGAQSWFDTNRADDDQHGPVDTREELRAYDPRLAACLVRAFGDGPWRYRRPVERPPAERGHLAGWDFDAAPRFAWPERALRAAYAHRREERRRERLPGEERVDWLLRRARRGDAEAQVELGWRHREGRGVPASDARALRYYRAAAAQGEPAGLDGLGWMLEHGRGADADPARAAELYRRSAELRHPQGVYNRGRVLLAGRGVARDVPRACAWLALAAERDHRDAAKLLRETRAALDAAQLARADAELARLGRGW